MTQDDRMETITDPAAIRATDEPDARGDFPCCTTPAPVGAGLDLDAMARRYSTATDDEVIYEMYPALEAEACRLTERADHKSALAADNARRAEAAEAEVGTLRAKLAAVEALPPSWIASTAEGMGRKIDHWRGDDYAEGFDAGVESCADTLRAALATTGEGQ